MDLSSIPGTGNSPLLTPAIFGDNTQNLLGSGAYVQRGATILVNSIDDAVSDNPGVTTLRDAINKANADSQKDLIVFDRSLFSTAQTIKLSLGELDITHDVDIVAPRDTLTGGDLVTVSGNKASRVFEIESGATVTFNGLIVADGSVTGVNGGGILNSGTLTLDSSIVRDNSATSSGSSGTFPPNIIGGSGGGIESLGTLTVNNSTISGNSVSRGGTGGGIYNSRGIVTVDNSTINGNSAVALITFGGIGGGIYNSGGTVTVDNSTISGNSARSGGGGIYNSSRTATVSSGTLTVNNSTISGNSANGNSTISGNSANGVGGGIENLGSLTVNNSTISGNSANGVGGGIENLGSLTVNNSTISGNSATRNGGGIYNSVNLSPSILLRVNNTLTVNNSTISGNLATLNGGGIYNEYEGTLTLLFSTVTQNIAANGGGVYQNDVRPQRPLPIPLPVLPRGSDNVRNTIIASNLNSEDGVNPDVSGTFTSLGYNLIGDSTGSNGFGETTWDIVGTADWPIDPRLAPLDFYGGLTQTIALLPDSPAIGAADPIILESDPTTDQRGLPRRAADGSADIGAFQFS